MSEPVDHEPVLQEEVLQTLDPAPGKTVFDLTLGLGGHSRLILARLGEEGLLVGVERDPQMLAEARRRLEAAGCPRSRYRLLLANHEDLAELIRHDPQLADVPAPDAVLLDLGPSTPQLLDPDRGLSWTSPSLDMRMNPRAGGPTAAEIVNSWPPKELARIFREYADERWAGPIAQRIAAERVKGPIESGRRLGEIVAAAIPRKAWPPRIHPATRVFLALRIEVNGEYRSLQRVLPAAFEALKPGGRLVVITFHGGEDRIVKQFMREKSTAELPPWPLPQGAARASARLLTRKPLTPREDELRHNPRSRSSKLRAIEKLGDETAG
ncbi:MAG TPA: 16S rRNA (cytosine(1402)-N(4))-methyltransferase RsmH [Candidatus Sumerlaeota bacterium]|nr:16S rRNA (cytosine(1402)-N(4))-methyltransferase RsmH [Candidatus Sumerlaeota bacterium]HOR29166.1 16S rRNA (cytosine(1402)-N(4))-methyltransferase RsmH [Candidatus Sumerlaeota bacterium]